MQIKSMTSVISYILCKYESDKSSQIHIQHSYVFSIPNIPGQIKTLFNWIQIIAYWLWVRLRSSITIQEKIYCLVVQRMFHHTFLVRTQSVCIHIYKVTNMMICYWHIYSLTQPFISFMRFKNQKSNYLCFILNRSL